MREAIAADGLAADLALALVAAERASAAVARRFRGPMEVRFKDPDQPVTAADLEADALLRDLLLRERPGYGWLSEESPPAPADERGRTWLVDPIDGTSSFVAGIPEFGVSIGLVGDGRVLLGVVANPATGEVYQAVRGGGAAMGGAALRVREAGSAPPVLLVSRSEQARGRFTRFGGWVQETCGSTTIKMCRVAAGLADAFVSFGPKRGWDVCAADLIVREAGGVVSDLGGAPLRFDDPRAAWAGLVVSGPSRHAELLRLAVSG